MGRGKDRKEEEQKMRCYKREDECGDDTGEELKGEDDKDREEEIRECVLDAGGAGEVREEQ